jgi:hypothetical protein
MKVKKGVKILGAVLGAAAISMTVICCYGPGGYIQDIGDNTSDYIEDIAKENSQLQVTFDEGNENKETE